MDIAALELKLLAAVKADDKAEIVRLYRLAGEAFIAQNDINAGCFNLTHAYVHALETNDPAAAGLHKTLVLYGREE